MLGSRLLLPCLTASALLVGCATSRSFDRSTEPGATPLPLTTASTLVLTGQTLSADPGLTVLEAISRAMPQLRVTNWSAVNECPVIELRGRNSVMGSPSPQVYVDGTRTVDTCPLVTLQAMDVRRIEVYPLGVTPRAGYASSGNGLILLFMQRADSADAR